MKSIVFACLLVVVGSNAFPQQSVDVDFASREERIITGNIIRAIEQIAQQMRDAGLDPLVVDRFDINHSFVPIVLTAAAYIDSLRVEGISNIAVNRMDYSLLTNRLQFDVSLPAIRWSLGEAGVRINAFGNRYTGSLSGTVEINQIRLIGDIRVNVGIISGISIRSMTINFRLGGIQSAQTLIVMDEDWSDDLNRLLNQTIPDLLIVFRDQIDSWLTDTIRAIADEILSNSLVAKDAKEMMMPMY